MVKKTEKTVSKKLYNKIISFTNQWDKMAGAYFWSSPSSAYQRRSYEKYNSDEISFIFDNKKYSAEIDVTCSCKNIYVSKSLFVDGNKKNITSLKKLTKKYELRLKQKEEAEQKKMILKNPIKKSNTIFDFLDLEENNIVALNN